MAEFMIKTPRAYQFAEILMKSGYIVTMKAIEIDGQSYIKIITTDESEKEKEREDI